MAAVFAPARGDRADRRGDRRLRRHRQHQQHHQAVIGGATEAVEQAVEAFQEAATRRCRSRSATPSTPRSWRRSSEPLRAVLQPARPAAARAPGGGQRRPASSTRRGRVEQQMLDILGRQVASPVQFVKGLETLLRRRARASSSRSGPSRRSRASSTTCSATTPTSRAVTNHPKLGDVVAFNQALCGLYAAGLGLRRTRADVALAVATVREADHGRTQLAAIGRRATTCTSSSARCSPTCSSAAATCSAGRRRRRRRRAGRDHRRGARAARRRARLRRRQRRPHPATASSSST